MSLVKFEDTALFQDIKKLIEQSRERVAAAFNSELAILYWNIGRRVSSDILGGERAEYGKKCCKIYPQGLH